MYKRRAVACSPFVFFSAKSGQEFVDCLIASAQSSSRNKKEGLGPRPISRGKGVAGQETSYNFKVKGIAVGRGEAITGTTGRPN